MIAGQTHNLEMFERHLLPPIQLCHAISDADRGKPITHSQGHKPSLGQNGSWGQFDVV